MMFTSSNLILAEVMDSTTASGKLIEVVTVSRAFSTLSWTFWNPSDGIFTGNEWFAFEPNGWIRYPWKDLTFHGQMLLILKHEIKNKKVVKTKVTFPSISGGVYCFRLV